METPIADPGFWPGWSLSTVAELATIILAGIALAFAVRTFGAALIVRYWGERRGQWPIGAKTLGAALEPSTFRYVTIGREKINVPHTWQAMVKVELRPRLGTWNTRIHPEVVSLTLTNGSKYSTGAEVMRTDLDANFPIDIDHKLVLTAYFSLPDEWVQRMHSLGSYFALLQVGAVLNPHSKRIVRAGIADFVNVKIRNQNGAALFWDDDNQRYRNRDATDL